MPGPGPTVTRRRLRTELRRLRKERNLSLETVSTRMEWSLSKLIRIENGSTGISANDLRVLVSLYDVTDADRIRDMLELARISRQRPWWSRYGEQISLAYRSLIGLEAEADRIREFHPAIIPGLVQTEAYAREIDATTAVDDPAGADGRIEIRMERQRRVLGSGEGPRLMTAFDETALQRPVGGKAVMREQLRHLINMAERHPNVELLVVPLGAGAHPGLFGAFTLLEFDDPEEPDVLYLDSAPMDIVQREHDRDVRMYQSAFARLADLGLRGTAAIARIRAAEKAFR